MGKDLKGKELGTGISQRKDGLYVARFTNRLGKRIAPMYAKTEREIKKKYRDAKYEDEHGLYGNADMTTFSEWFDTWAQLYGQTRIKESTLDGYIRHFNAQIRPYLGRVKLKALTPLMIQEWMQQRHANGLKSVAAYLSTIKTVLNDAVVAGLLSTNPAEKIVGISHKAIKTPALTQKQLHYFLDHFEFQSKYMEWKLVIRFLSMTGYRFGEMAGLSWDNIDWDANIIHVQKTLHHRRNSQKSIYFTTPKSKAGARDTPMSHQLKALLMEVWQLQQQWITQYPSYWGKQLPEAKGLVFLSKFGTPLNNGTFNDVLRKVIHRMNQNLPAKEQLPVITAHSFRDTFASICYELHIPIKEVQKLMGHEEQAMTLYYTDVPLENVAKQMERLHQELEI